jgi:hypothetical protein
MSLSFPFSTLMKGYDSTGAQNTTHEYNIRAVNNFVHLLYQNYPVRLGVPMFALFANRIRRPVERDGAAFYVLLTLLSFALSVVLTRLFLQLTGYPQLGGATLHIAHLLWGGLLLFIGALAMLIFANRWVYRLGAVLTGVGVGLFIDEVGKFITRTNDYFYPPAAPIIYVFFLLVVLLYLQIRRPRNRTARTELYRVFDTLEEVLERDLDDVEHESLKTRLEFVVKHADYPEQAQLAKELLRFIHSEHVALVERKPGWGERSILRLKTLDERWITKGRLKAVLVGGLGTLGLWAVQDLVIWLFAFFSPLRLERSLLNLANSGRLSGSTSLNWLGTAVSLQAACGVVVIIGTVLLILNRDRRGVSVSFLGLLLFLTITNLLEFYFDQFITIGPAMIEFALLLLLIHYRRRFIPARI